MQEKFNQQEPVVLSVQINQWPGQERISFFTSSHLQSCLKFHDFVECQYKMVGNQKNEAFLFTHSHNILFTYSYKE